MKLMQNRLVIMAILFVALEFFSCSKKNYDACHEVNATGKGQTVAQTATGGTTKSEISGDGLQGTAIANLVFTGADAAGNLLFEGTLVLTNSQGTLSFNFVNGKANPATGEFSNNANVTSGTGAYNNASGKLYFHGFTHADGSFVDDKIIGKICNSKPGKMPWK